jgi:hypothetical protein
MTLWSVEKMYLRMKLVGSGWTPGECAEACVDASI